MRHTLAGIVFLALGAIFLYKDLHMMHGTHGNTLLGLGEMTWMWFTMALVHFVIRDCSCKKSRK